MSEFVEDKNGNMCFFKYFGSEKEAVRALASLKNCHNCVDCFECEDCVKCLNCRYCKGCKDCVNCSGCFRCISCDDCLSLEDCSTCHWSTNVANCRKNSGPLNMKLVPIVQDIHRRIYEAATIRGSLNMDAIHTCYTTHCRAGWAIELAGESGYELAAATSGIFAAMMIYKVSGYPISPVRFFETGVQALQDMRALAFGGSLRSTNPNPGGS